MMAARKLKWFVFEQANVGGEYVVTDKLCRRVVVEAYDMADAKNKVYELGGYFNGVAHNIDCPCCGDRWQDPEIFSPWKMLSGAVNIQTIEDDAHFCAGNTPHYKRYRYTSPDTRIFHESGTITEIFHDEMDTDD